MSIAEALAATGGLILIVAVWAGVSTMDGPRWGDRRFEQRRRIGWIAFGVAVALGVAAIWTEALT